MNNTSTLSTHRLSGDFDPSQYEILEWFDESSVATGYDHQDMQTYEQLDPMGAELAQKIVDQGFDSWRCTHCGHSLVRGYVCEHRPTGDLVILGERCIDRLGFDDRQDIKNALKENRIYIANLRKLMGFKKRWQVVIGFLQQVSEDPIYNSYARNLAEDMLRKCSRYLGLSLAQIRFVHKVAYESVWLKCDEEYEVEERERQERIAKSAEPLDTEGRPRIEGTVVCVKHYEDYGYTKMMVLTEKFQKVWVSRFLNAERGDWVAFNARLQVSKDDSTFYFASRPTKQEIEEGSSGA